ncbi:cytochrome C [candidate division GN15 bacterium]|nr:cytochrome C [candidate division GN15 bacterium]
MAEPVQKRTVFRTRMAAIGGALFLAGGFLFLILLFFDLTASHENPYRALVTWVGVPFVITLGFVLFVISVWRQVRQARKEGRKVKFNLSIDPTDPAYMRNLWLFLGLCAGLLILVVYSGTKAYEATDSVEFCGETCHTVMEPQAVTYENSAHARVPCVDCHIGPGASFYVRSKVDGIRQLWNTALNTYSRPIETPVANLRPAQETCENCHWPRQFYGDKLVTRTYYRTDEDNSPWTINLLLKIGGGNPRTGRNEGIHWHMVTANDISYVATDHKRQNIVWVQVVTPEGDTTIYTRSGADMPDFDSNTTEVRNFDCMDCHNRPSHKFLAPATSLNLALAAERISDDIPYIRQVGLEVLNAEYDTRPQAQTMIADSLRTYYQEEYPEFYAAHEREIDEATLEILDIYNHNFFPEMNTDYRVRENNLSHFVNDGCFRCHSSAMQDADGNSMEYDCESCHLILAQGPSEHPDSLESNISGLTFRHPEDIGEMWRETLCTDCHTPEQGY